MGKVYKGQTKLIINVNAGVDITGATITLKYQKPNHKTGQFTGVITSASTGDFKYEITSADDLDIVGKWIMWSHIIFSDSKIGMGEPFVLEVFKEGK